jgi:hypothetical protein
MLDIVRDIGAADILFDQFGVAEVVLDHDDFNGRAHQ